MSVADMGIADTLLTSYYPEYNEAHDDKKVMIEDILLPHTSNFSVGHVEVHDVNVPHQYCFYIVSNDKKSVGWLKENMNFLKKKNCIGIVTRIDNMETLRKMENRFNTIFFPININGFESMLKTSHYPLAVYNGRVMQ